MTWSAIISDPNSSFAQLCPQHMGLLMIPAASSHLRDLILSGSLTGMLCPQISPSLHPGVLQIHSIRGHTIQNFTDPREGWIGTHTHFIFFQFFPSVIISILHILFISLLLSPTVKLNEILFLGWEGFCFLLSPQCLKTFLDNSRYSVSDF